MVSAKVKEKVNENELHQKMRYGLKTILMSKRQEAEVEIAELKILHFSMQVTRK